MSTSTKLLKEISNFARKDFGVFYYRNLENAQLFTSHSCCIFIIIPFSSSFLINNDIIYHKICFYVYFYLIFISIQKKLIVLGRFGASWGHQTDRKNTQPNYAGNETVFSANSGPQNSAFSSHQLSPAPDDFLLNKIFVHVNHFMNDSIFFSSIHLSKSKLNTSLMQRFILTLVKKCLRCHVSNELYHLVTSFSDVIVLENECFRCQTPKTLFRTISQVLVIRGAQTLSLSNFIKIISICLNFYLYMYFI